MRKTRLVVRRAFKDMILMLDASLTNRFYNTFWNDTCFQENLRQVVKFSNTSKHLCFAGLKLQWNLSLQTPLQYGQLTWSWENAHTFFVKITSSVIWTLCNTDNEHEISAPERKFIQTLPLYYGHSNDDSSYSTRFPGFRYISKCDQLSHCSHNDNIICFQSVKSI